MVSKAAKLLVALVFLHFSLAAVAGAATTDYEMQASLTPSFGKPPLEVTLQVSATSPMLCTAFSVDWGDGSQPEEYVPDSFTGCSDTPTFSKTLTHTYNPQSLTNPITYQVTVKAGPATLEDLRPITLTVTLSPDGTLPSGDTTQTSTRTSSCFVDPAYGYRPMEAKAYVALGGSDCGPDKPMFYYVDWGDGTVTTTKLCNESRIRYDTFTHRYTEAKKYTATLYKTYHKGSSQEYTETETCEVTVLERPVLQFLKPVQNAIVPIGSSYTIKLFAEHLPGVINNLAPKLRLLFVTEDGQAGYIGDITSLTEQASSTYEFIWEPTDEECAEGQICPTPVIPGVYRLVASVIYDICNGDPYCGKEFPIVVATSSPATIEIVESVDEQKMVADRLFVYPQTSKKAPAIVYFTSVLNSEASCLGGAYTFEFGDGSYHTVTYPRGRCEAFATTFSHTYEKPGVYLVTVRKDGVPVLYQRVAVLDEPVASAGGQLAAIWQAISNIIRTWFSW